jgi:hypothetical protein
MLCRATASEQRMASENLVDVSQMFDSQFNIGCANSVDERRLSAFFDSFVNSLIPS